LIKAVPQPLTAPVPRGGPIDAGSARSLPWCRWEVALIVTPPQEQGKPVKGLDYAGGFVLKGPTGTVASSNITPDASGISYYDENLFRRAMHEGKVGARTLNATMPWTFFARMTDDDLKSVFAYLRTLKPIKHRVDNTVPPTYCKLCRNETWPGDSN